MPMLGLVFVSRLSKGLTFGIRPVGVVLRFGRSLPGRAGGVLPVEY